MVFRRARSGKVIPPNLWLWLVKSPGYVSESDEVQQVIMQVAITIDAVISAAGLGEEGEGGPGPVPVSLTWPKAVSRTFAPFAKIRVLKLGQRVS